MYITNNKWVLIWMEEYFLINLEQKQYNTYLPKQYNTYIQNINTPTHVKYVRIQQRTWQIYTTTTT